MCRSSPTSTLFPYTTLFRSLALFDKPEIAFPAQIVQHESQALQFGRRQRRIVDVEDLARGVRQRDRKSTRLNSSHVEISYAVFCLKKKNTAPPAALPSARKA